MVVYLDQIGHPTSYYHMAVLAGALTFCLGAAYVPWMASFTETVEAHNPALTATGLAIWGWIARMVVFVWYLLLPVVVHSVTPVVVYGAESEGLHRAICTAARRHRIAPCDRADPRGAPKGRPPCGAGASRAHPWADLPSDGG